MQRLNEVLDREPDVSDGISTDTSITELAGRIEFRDLSFRAIPLYHGRPWFLPLAGLAYKVLDWLD